MRSASSSHSDIASNPGGESGSGIRLRPYQPADRAAVGDICVRTGASGQDATGHYADDELLPALYAYPYVDAEPQMAWVLEDAASQQVVGYILGTSDTVALVSWWEENWVPALQELFPDTAGWEEPDRRLLSRAQDPSGLMHAFVDSFPAEFHIDLLPAAQGGGWGRALVDAFMGELRVRGVPGVAIGVGSDNEKAVGFYRRLGFEVLKEHVDEDGRVTGYLLGLRT